VLASVASGCVPGGGGGAVVEAPRSDGTESMLREGTAMPDVAGTAASGKTVRLQQLRGKVVVLCFYPMDFAVGATALVQELESDQAKYKRLGAVVVAISADDPQSHRAFAEKHKLSFLLLADTRGEMARAFGVPLEGGVPRHGTFVVDRGGTIRKVWRKVRPWGHSAEVLAAVKDLGKR
jgi:thioredoxin-dependent peroxiredoxin